MSEQWRDISGTDGRHQVSDMGRLRSCVRGRLRVIKQQAVMSKARVYMRVRLRRYGRYRTCRVHRLVLEAFLWRCPHGKEGSHINGDTTDNRLTNLEWVTHLQNESRKDDHGTRTRKLADSDVIDIRKRYHDRQCTQHMLADEFGVTPQSIHNAVTGKTYAHVGGPLTHRGSGRWSVVSHHETAPP